MYVPDAQKENVANAMKLAMVYIVSSSAYQRGQLTWDRMDDLRMAFVEEVEPLIPKDLHAKVMAETIMNPPTLRRKPRKTAR